MDNNSIYLNNIWIYRDRFDTIPVFLCIAHLQFTRAHTVLTDVSGAIAVLKPLAVGSAAPACLYLALTPLTSVKTLRPDKEKIFCSSRRIRADIADHMASVCNAEMRKIFPCEECVPL